MESYRYIIKIIFIKFIVLNIGGLPKCSGGENGLQPLRIDPYFANINNELEKSERELLKATVNNIVIYIKRLFSVIPVKGPLLLERGACRSAWTKGRNAGKCAHIKKDYVGELCQDNFAIPDDHLEAFYTWTNKPLPDKTWYTDGNGVRNTDFILYVQSSTTKSCLSNFQRTPGHKTIAYASYCKLGESGRPIAGYINFCPSELRNTKHNKEKLLLTVLHEMFHALGFSKDLILKYKDCSKFPGISDDCPVWGFPILRQSGQNHLLLTPTVVEKMQEHFACNKADFGGPLISRHGQLQSHWDPKVLRGSIMTPALEEPENTFIDPITLAVFSDMGWYKVNFSNADSYPYGKGSGCNLNTDRESDSRHLCSYSYNSVCDNWFSTTIVNCSQAGSDTSDHAHNCDTSTEPQQGKLQRCLQESSPQAGVGRCFTVKCLGHSDIWVEVGDNNWLQCPERGTIQLTYADVEITCPHNAAVFCYRRSKQVYLEDLVSLESTTLTQRPKYYVTQNLQGHDFTSGIQPRREHSQNSSLSKAICLHSLDSFSMRSFAFLSVCIIGIFHSFC